MVLGLLDYVCKHCNKAGFQIDTLILRDHLPLRQKLPIPLDRLLFGKYPSINLKTFLAEF